MSKFLKKCCKGSFTKPLRKRYGGPFKIDTGECPHCYRWVGLMNSKQLASHYPVKPKR
jgi:hypothetical protein